jgi:hypothetical protein
LKLVAGIQRAWVAYALQELYVIRTVRIEKALVEVRAEFVGQGFGGEHLAGPKTDRTDDRTREFAIDPCIEHFLF